MAAPPTHPSHRLCALIHQLRHHKPIVRQISGEAATEDETAALASESGGRDLDDRGKVFSSIGFSESASPSMVLPSPDHFHRKRAAVLICLFEGENGVLRVILTKRSSNLSTHSGEVSLPGGKAEAGDADDRETATREAKEEIGLDPSLVTTVAILEPFLSRLLQAGFHPPTGVTRLGGSPFFPFLFVNQEELWFHLLLARIAHLLRVVPVIGVLSDKKAFSPILNAAEVETIFDAPLEMFLKDENHRSEEREWMGEKYMLHYFDYETNKKKFVIWGLTATILIHAASVVYQQQPSFPEMKPIYKDPANLKGISTMT